MPLFTEIVLEECKRRFNEKKKEFEKNRPKTYEDKRHQGYMRYKEIQHDMKAGEPSPWKKKIYEELRKVIVKRGPNPEQPGPPEPDLLKLLKKKN